MTSIPHLHDTTGCTARWTTGCIMQTNIQPFVQPIKCLFTQYHQLYNWLYRANTV